MGLLDTISRNAPDPKPDPNQLSVVELEYLLNTLKQTTLRGEQIELFYGMVVKLQNQYIALTNK